MRMTIALQHLGRDFSRPQTQLLAGDPFYIRRRVGECADRATDLADAYVLYRRIETLTVAQHLGVIQREFQPECRRLGMDTMRAAHHHRPLVREHALPAPQSA